MTSIEEKCDKKCGKCKTYRYPSQFLKKGREMKTCQRCRDISTKSRNKHKDKNKDKYKCEHGRYKSQCVDCGTGRCEHGRVKSYCKDCGDEIKITFKNMLKHSKSSDKNKNMYDPNNFIDYCFLEMLMGEYTHCYWEDCKCELQYLEYKGNLATIERLDNSIGHTKANCVFACLKCNAMKKSNRQI